MLGKIFTKAQNKIQDPAKLYRLICSEFFTQKYSFGDSLSVDRPRGLQLESWLGSPQPTGRPTPAT